MIVNKRVSLWQQTALVGLIGGFVVMGILRLNDCDLFNPDSPRYVIYSRAIVDLGEYRATDLPGSPLYSWRPPGLSLLLAPVMAFRPYDVVAAKTVVLATGALLLWVVFQLTRMHSPFWPAFLVTAMVASSPSFFVLSTEVLTEIPYTLGVCVVLLILGHSAPSNANSPEVAFRRTRFVTMIGACFVLAYVPWLRTAGVSLVAAVGMWSLLSRSRWHWLSGVVAASMGLGLLAMRNRQASGENYVGSLFSRMKTQGIGSTVVSGAETVWHYVCTVPGLLLPGLTTDRAWYSPLTIGVSPTLVIPYLLAACLAAVIVSLAMLGMCQRRAHGGSLALLYILVYCACLVVWPWRHERFVWPLIPVFLSYVPTGFQIVTALIPGLPSGLSTFGGAMLIGLCGWQTYSCQQIVATNRDFITNPETFHATRIPSFYFSDWRRAGKWLNEHSSPSARVLTWHAAVAGTSHRFQKRVQFETISPEKLRAQIEGFGARYLIVPLAQFGDGFPWQTISGNPAMKLNVVYHERDVAILEVEPNRTGEVSKTEYPDWVETQVERSAEALKQSPGRTDFEIRQASLLHESGRDEEALRAFQKIYSKGTKTARVCSELGWLLYEARDYANAANFLDMARLLPNAESIAPLLIEGAASARQRINQNVAEDESSRIKRQLNRTKSLINLFKYSSAERIVDGVLKKSPDHPEAQFLKGKLLHLFGEVQAAEEHYERSIELGCVDATSWLTVLRYHNAISRQETTSISVGDQKKESDPARPETHLKMAELFREHGWSGQALATLEAANERFPDQSTIQQQLADLYCVFARPDLAVPLYESALKNHQNDESIQKGLLAAQQKLFEPFMFPLASYNSEDSTKFPSSLEVSHR